MESLAEELKKKYVEEIVELVRPQHFLLLLCASIAINFCIIGKNDLYKWLWNQSIGDLAGNDFLSVKIGTIFIASIFVGANSFLYKAVSGEFFDLFSKSHDLDGFISNIDSHLSSIEPSQKDRLSNIIEKDISTYRKAFNRRARNIEFLLGISLLFLLSMTTIDALISVVIFSYLVYSLYQNYKLFITKLSPSQYLLDAVTKGTSSIRDFFTESKK